MEAPTLDTLLELVLFNGFFRATDFRFFQFAFQLPLSLRFQFVWSLVYVYRAIPKETEIDIVLALHIREESKLENIGLNQIQLVVFRIHIIELWNRDVAKSLVHSDDGALWVAWEKENVSFFSVLGQQVQVFEGFIEFLNLGICGYVHLVLEVWFRLERPHLVPLVLAEPYLGIVFSLVI